MEKQREFAPNVIGGSPQAQGYFTVPRDMHDAPINFATLSTFYNQRMKSLSTKQRLLLPPLAQNLGGNFDTKEAFALKEQGKLASIFTEASRRDISKTLNQLAAKGILNVVKARGNDRYAFSNTGVLEWLRGDTNMQQPRTLKELNDPAPLPR